MVVYLTSTVKEYYNENRNKQLNLFLLIRAVFSVETENREWNPVSRVAALFIRANSRAKPRGIACLRRPAKQRRRQKSTPTFTRLPTPPRRRRPHLENRDARLTNFIALEHQTNRRSKIHPYRIIGQLNFRAGLVRTRCTCVRGSKGGPSTFRRLK